MAKPKVWLGFAHQYCVLDRPVFEQCQTLLHPELTPWWSFLLADGAHHKKPHSPTHLQTDAGNDNTWRPKLTSGKNWHFSLKSFDFRCLSHIVNEEVWHNFSLIQNSINLHYSISIQKRFIATNTSIFSRYIHTHRYFATMRGVEARHAYWALYRMWS